jgi:carbon-monoxide dehydrogenase large subunit
MTTLTRRLEDRRFITGTGRYASDWNLPGQLHCAFLRSDVAHAGIVSLNIEAARTCPGVAAVLTGRDCEEAGYGPFPLAGSFFNSRGEKLIMTKRSVLATDRVRFVGEPVACVVAESAPAAQDALEAIAIEYRDLPAVVTVEDAMAEGAPQLHHNVPGNVCFEMDAGDANAVEKAFAGAAHITQIKLVSTRVVPSPMEPRAYVVAYDAAGECYDIYTAAQGASMLASQISALTNVPQERIRLHLHDVGGSFGQRSGVYPEHAALMLASRRTGRPVKWVSSRSEGFLSDMHGRGFHWDAALALDRDGRFLAARYDAVLDLGAYLTTSVPGGHLRNPVTCMTGVYRVPALCGTFKVVVNNTVPLGAYRGTGRPDIAYVVERLVDKAAAELNIDRAELRRRNFIPPEAFPYQTPTIGVYEKADFAGCLAKALETSDWNHFDARRAASRSHGRLRGIGLSSVIEGTSPGRAPQDEIAIEFDARGRLAVYTATLSGGQGHETAFAQIVAETLGIAIDSVAVRESVLGRSLDGNATLGSRSTVGAGSVCKLAAQKLIEKAASAAAEELGVEPSQVHYQNGQFAASENGRSISLEALARKLASNGPHPLNVRTGAKIGQTFPNGCHVAEVEIDPETGRTTIVSYVAVDDCGTVVNHTLVEGQVHGGVTQGAGQILSEEIVYDRASGQLLTGSFSDYGMPHAGLIKKIRVEAHSVPSSTNALGAKGVGESGCTASLPAIANAIMDALRSAGVGELDMPFTPNKVWQALRSASARQ